MESFVTKIKGTASVYANEYATYINCGLCFTFGAMISYALHDYIKNDHMKITEQQAEFYIKTAGLEAKLISLEARLVKIDDEKSAADSRIAFLERMTLNAD